MKIQLNLFYQILNLLIQVIHNAIRSFDNYIISSSMERIKNNFKKKETF